MDDPKAGFNIESLVVCILDLFEAGTESAATTLRWALVYMVNYPEIQGENSPTTISLLIRKRNS